MSLFMVDEIDRFLRSQLGKNSRTSSYEMSRYLQEMGYKITDRTVRHRLKRLEKSNIILAYSLLLNPALLSEKINRTILLKFKFRADTSVMISRLEKYCGESYFCIFSARMTGDFDWICHFVFDSVEQYEFESSNFLNRFIDLIDDFRSYESSMVKVTNNKKPSTEEYREKVVEFMRQFESILSVQLSAGEHAASCLDYVKKLLNAQILLIRRGNNKEVERRFHYYVNYN